MQIPLFLGLCLFFAINMGGSGIAPAMSAAYGASIITKRLALLLFALFVLIGALLASGNVIATLSRGIIPEPLVDIKVAMVVIAAASMALVLANIMHIPQSTSQATVGALVGIGAYFGAISNNLALIVGMWVILPITAYILTLICGKFLYPVISRNGMEAKLIARRRALKLMVIATGCYVAFGIGANNVANAVGPAVGANIISPMTGVLLIAPAFGIGALVLGHGPLKTTGQEITELGLLSSSLVSAITGTLLLLASYLGIPQSLVQLSAGSILAVGVTKNGGRATMQQQMVRRGAMVWIIAPIISMAIAYFGLALIV